MERRRFGKTGMMVSPLGFGGSEIGGSRVAGETVDALLNAALDAGLNVVDTAECYGDSEEKIGRAIGSRRDEFFLFTKCGHASGVAGEDWDPAVLAATIERSLVRLKTDCVDLIQLHSCSKELLQSGGVIEPLVRAKEAGKTRFIGYSGDGENARWAIESGVFDTLQTSVNIADQEAIDLLLPLAQKKEMGVIAKRPIANVAWTYEPTPGDYGYEYGQRFKKLAFPHLEEADAVAQTLRFCLACPGVGTAIVGTTNPGRWAENAGLLESAIDPQLFEAIRMRWRERATADWNGQT
jgi:aryl-alcohol dehydrogenase-like predicted oxidoreductase